ncbi:glycosyltransferase [Pleurocapsa sp. PCC 7327]|nr:glycosyltransferase [Pleurocapsa sp. PCC 7327]
MLKVLHINQSDLSGGAAIASYSLHRGLLDRGIDSRLLVGRSQSKSDRVATIPRKHRLENPIASITRPLGFNYVQYVGAFDILKHEFYQNADLLNFHNLHGGTFNYLAIPLLTENKPAVFTLHDMWSFTGHCSYSYDCDRWKIGCGRCPYPHIYPAIKKDNTRLVWKLKDWVYRRSDLTVVTPSRWLAGLAKLSMLNRFPIHHIPNGIDVDAYQPRDPAICKELLGIQADKKVLMFGADSIKDPRKGSNILLQALSSLPASVKAETILLTIGNSSEAISEVVGIETLNLGYVSHARFKAIAYSAADLFIFPTRADNLPLMLQESMSCGTPMVSFKIGGVPDLVRPGITGYLAEPGNASDLNNGIVQLLEDNSLRERMSRECRAIALAEYSLDLQIRRYIDLYEQILLSKAKTLAAHD